MAVSDDAGSIPSGTAHAAMAWHLEDTDYARTVALTPAVNAYLFRGNGKAAAVLSPIRSSAAR